MEDDEDINAIRNYPSDEEAFPFWNNVAEDIYQDYLLPF